MHIPYDRPLDANECDALALELERDYGTAIGAVIRLASADGARVRRLSCHICDYVFIDDRISDALRLALTMNRTHDHDFHQYFTEYDGGCFHCLGSEYWCFVWD